MSEIGLEHRSFGSCETSWMPQYLAVSPSMLVMQLCILAAFYFAGISAVNADCPVFCSGPILHAVQTSGIFNDSKTWVDMPMKYNVTVVENAFARINSSDKSQLAAFVDEHFAEVGSDLLFWTPSDFTPNASFLASIENTTLRAWAYDINYLWVYLGRKANETIALHPDQHTLLPRAFPFIVPGGRFDETYYWDSYWIVKGLLTSYMFETASYLILNLLDDVASFGFVPNGARRYFLDRSQPPLLTRMVYELTSSCNMLSSSEKETHTTCTDANMTSFMDHAFPLLEKEYAFWMDTRNGHLVNISSTNSDSFLLNRYYSNTTLPRPESYEEDVETSESTARNASLLFRDIRAGAETGWDFSSRWIYPPFEEAGMAAQNLSNISTTAIVPVDLNTFLFDTEIILANFASLQGQSSLAGLTSWERLVEICAWGSEDDDDEATGTDYYCSQAYKRFSGMSALLWNETDACWKDLWLPLHEAQTNTFPSLSSSLSSVRQNTHVLPVSSYIPLASLLSYKVCFLSLSISVSFLSFPVASFH